MSQMSIQMTVKSYRMRLIIWGTLASLITIPIFIRGIEFNVLELVLIYIGIITAKIPIRNLDRSVVNKRLLILTAEFFGLFLVYILLGIFYAYSTAAVFKVFFKWSEIFIIAIFIFHYIDSHERFSTIYWFLFFVNLALVAKALILTYFGESQSVSMLPRIRIGHSTVFAIALLLPFATKHNSRILLYSLVLVLVLSQSRASWIEFIVVFFVFVYYAKDNRKLYRNVGVSVLLIIGCILFIPAVRNMMHQRISHLGILEEKPASSTFQRLYRLEACYQAFLDAPVFGVAAGNILYYTEKKGTANILTRFQTRENDTLTPHNVYAEYLAGLGLVGFAIFISVLLLLYKIIFYVRHYGQLKHQPELLGVHLYFFVFLIFLAFGYIAGTDRLALGIYLGLILALLKWPTFYSKNKIQN